MSEETELRAIIAGLEEQVNFAYSRNREMVFEMVDLKIRLARLEEENRTLRSRGDEHERPHRTA